MASKMHILGWKVQGLRCPDHEINCCDSQGNLLSITLIQMPNGTGKTTTLDLLRAALSGEVANDSWDQTKVRKFQKHDGATSNGKFELRLLLNDDRVTIIMEFDFGNGWIQYKTTKEPQGQDEGFNPPREFSQFMKKEFVKFFVFDGELADKILDRDHTDAETAVESLFQIHLLKDMREKVSHYWDEQTQGTTAKNKTGLKGRGNRLKEWRDRLSELKKQKKGLENEHERVVDTLRQAQERCDNEIKKNENLQTEMRKAEAAVNNAKNNVDIKAQAVLDLMRDPHRLSTVFADSIHELKTGLDRVKLPETAAKEFFEELIYEKECICGRNIDENIKNAIRERAERYLGSDNMSLLNRIKTSIDDAVGKSRTTPAEDLSKNIQDLAKLDDEHVNAKNDLDAVRQDAARSNPDVKHAHEEIVRLKVKKKQLEDDLLQFNESDEGVNFDKINKVDLNHMYSIETVDKGIKILEEKVAEATNTFTLRRKRDLLMRIIGNSHQKANEYITSKIRDDANNKIAELMPDNKIRISEIDGCLVLEGQSSGSAGENLSIGYAFLATLFNRDGEHKLPFVVDSPVGPIDNDIRPKIGQLVPTLTHQFIAFVISSERPAFLSALQKAAKQEINYVTLFKKSNARYAEKAKQSAGFSVTDDGIQVVDKQFFVDFQPDSEEDA